MQDSCQIAFKENQLMDYPIKNLWSLYLELSALEDGLHQLSQTPRRERGGYASRHLSPITIQLENTLHKSFHSLFTDIVASLKGRSDDIVTGRFHQAKHNGSIAEAASWFGLDETELGSPVDKSRLEAVLALLALWKSRHTTLLQEAAQKAFDEGRNKAITAANLPEHQPITAAEVSPAFLARYESDVVRLAAELENGTKRFAGIREIIEKSATLGDVALQLRRLEDIERFRLDLMSEHLVWWGSDEGLRSGAKEVTSLQLATLGYASVRDVPTSLLNKVSRYIWAGPEDERTCDNCASTFGDPIFADDLVSPSSICRYSEGCRHSWEPFSG